MWTTVCPATLAAKSAVPRPRTASTAAPSASIRITVRARRKTSAGSAATAAPTARSGSQAAAVRFQTTSSAPERARFRAIGCPITPRPMNPASMATP